MYYGINTSYKHKMLKILKIKSKSTEKIKLILFSFVAIFQPPFFPVSLIYIVGILDVLLLVINGRKKSIRVFKESGMQKLYFFLLLIFFYMLFISIGNILFMEKVSLFSNRLRCINQLLVLTIIEFLSIVYILVRTEKYNFSIDEVLEIIIWAGLLQGICAVLAYNVPIIRSLFVKFGDSNLFSNAYVWERRGYGFAMTLIDTFGYGMGLLGGYALFSIKKKPILKIVSIALITFSILMNARTGFIVLMFAILIEMFISTERKKLVIFKIIIAIIVLYISIIYVLPNILAYGMKSSNLTFSWVATDMNELYNDIFNHSSNSFSDSSYISATDVFPTNIFELIFGSGHSIYDTTQQLGFRTDVGYINNLWTYGVVGTVIIEIYFGLLFFRAYKVANNEYKKIILLNAIAYYVVQVKAILIGYNPGVFLTYLTTFVILFYSKKNTFAIR